VALLYSNENFPLPVVEELRRLGHNVLTVFEAGNAEQAIPDDQVLEFAVSLGRVVGLFTVPQRFVRRRHQCRGGNSLELISTCRTSATLSAAAEWWA
jgi:hypothetical protein